MSFESNSKIRIHPSADVSDQAVIGDGTSIWHECQVREGAQLGRNCNLGKGVYIDFDVRIGDNCKIQNRASVYHGTTLAEGVFVGPHVVFTNDKRPRAINSDGTPKSDDDWQVSPIQVERGASLGAGSIILPGVDIGQFALVGSGAVVTRDVPAHAIVVGNPARQIGYACVCAAKLESTAHVLTCPNCDRIYTEVDGALRLCEASRENG